jgi:hypothetical protein
MRYGGCPKTGESLDLPEARGGFELPVPIKVATNGKLLRHVASEIASQAGIPLARAAYHPLTLLSDEHLTCSNKADFLIGKVVHHNRNQSIRIAPEVQK